METIKLTQGELRTLKKAKKELRSDSNATFTSNRKNNQKFIDVAEKYNVDIQVIWDSVKI